VNPGIIFVHRKIANLVIMKKLLTLFGLLGAVILNAQTMYNIVSKPSGFKLSCTSPTLDISVVASSGSPVTFTCVGSNFSGSGSTVNINTAGAYTLYLLSGTVTTVAYFGVGSIINAPVISINPGSYGVLYVTPGQTLYPTFTLTSNYISPYDDFEHKIYTPNHTLFTVNSPTATYKATVAGSYTHCVIDRYSGCKTCEDFFVEQVNPTGIKTESGKNTITVYPNPASEYINISGQITGADIEIIDVFGKRIYFQKSPANTEVNILSIANGVYFLRLSRSDKEVSCTRFVISR
jgi:hypothetical protein